MNEAKGIAKDLSDMVEPRNVCEGTGKYHNKEFETEEKCFMCDGSGVQKCRKCHGSPSRLKCDYCNSTGPEPKKGSEYLHAIFGSSAREKFAESSGVYDVR